MEYGEIRKEVVVVCVKVISQVFSCRGRGKPRKVRPLEPVSRPRLESGISWIRKWEDYQQCCNLCSKRMRFVSRLRKWLTWFVFMIFLSFL